MKRVEITDETKLADLTVTEFQNLLRDVMGASLYDFISSLPDPDQQKNIKQEVEAEVLEENADESYQALEEIKRTLGLDAHD